MLKGRGVGAKNHQGLPILLFGSVLHEFGWSCPRDDPALWVGDDGQCLQNQTLTRGSTAEPPVIPSALQERRLSFSALLGCARARDWCLALLRLLVNSPYHPPYYPSNRCTSAFTGAEAHHFYGSFPPLLLSPASVFPSAPQRLLPSPVPARTASIPILTICPYPPSLMPIGSIASSQTPRGMSCAHPALLANPQSARVAFAAAPRESADPPMTFENI